MGLSNAFPLFALILLSGQALHHDFAAVEETYLVSQSQGLKDLYKCKDRCLAMKDYFS